MKRRHFIAGTLSCLAVRPAFASLPGGHYLTPTSADDPIVTADITSTTLYSTPLLGESNAVTVNDGTGFVLKHSNQMALALSSSVHLQDIVYPIFQLYASGSPFIASGPAWSDSAAGAAVVGSAAACGRDPTSGLIVNTAQMQMFNGGFFTVAAGMGRMIGVICPYANGTLRKDVSIGAARRCDVWNLNNQQRVRLTATESTALWTIPSSWGLANPRTLNNLLNCKVRTLTGWPTTVRADYFQELYPGGINVDLGINWNGNESISHKLIWDSEVPVVGRFDAAPIRARTARDGVLGPQELYACEMLESFLPGDTTGTQNAIEMYGGPDNCRLEVEYLG